MVDPYPQPRPGPSRAWWIVLAALVAALLVGAGVLIGNHAGAKNSPAAPPTAGSNGATSTPTTAATTSTTPGDDGCPTFPHSPTNVPITAPAATWIQRGFVTLPVSVDSPSGDSVNGPAVVTASKPLACFAHTPTGALFAAAASAADALNPAVLLDWAKHRVTGPGQAAAIQAASQVSTTATSDGRSIQVVGFRMVDCSRPDRCVIDLASTVTLSDGAQATGAGTAVMVWSNGDWLYFQDLTPDQPRPINGNDLPGEGFIRWSP